MLQYRVNQYQSLSLLQNIHLIDLSISQAKFGLAQVQ